MQITHKSKHVCLGTQEMSKVNHHLKRDTLNAFVSLQRNLFWREIMDAGCLGQQHVWIHVQQSI